MFVKATILITKVVAALKETEKPVKIQTSKETLNKIRVVISCCINYVLPPCYIKPNRVQNNVFKETQIKRKTHLCASLGRSYKYYVNSLAAVDQFFVKPVVKKTRQDKSYKGHQYYSGES